MEVPCLIDRNGARPLATGMLPIRGLSHAAKEQCYSCQLIHLAIPPEKSWFGSWPQYTVLLLRVEFSDEQRRRTSSPFLSTACFTFSKDYGKSSVRTIILLAAG